MHSVISTLQKFFVSLDFNEKPLRPRRSVRLIVSKMNLQPPHMNWFGTVKSPLSYVNELT